MTRGIRIPAAVVAALVLAGAARASASAPRLASPPPGAVVRSGDTVTLAVANPPAGADEWEAFVSVDGGRSFSLRVTPHLPIGELSFPWIVPTVPSPDVRVRVRFGVGGVEREFLFDEAFSIATGPGGGVIAPARSAIGASPAAGEEGTVAWVDRDAGGVRLVVPASPSGIEPASRWTATAPTWLSAPRRRGSFLPPAVSAVKLSDSGRQALAPPPPLGRTIASLPRLNV